MAKSKKTEEIDPIFSQLIEDQNSVAKNAATTGDEMFAAVTSWIPTGSVALDTILSNDKIGGWPVGRIIELYGEEAIGKSTLCYQAMGEVQRLGGIPIMFDIEQAASENIMRACGVDMRKIITSRLTSLEEIFDALEKNLQTIIETPRYRDKPVFICMDSLAQMSVDAEIESDYELNMNTGLQKAKLLGLALRKITPFLNKANAVLIIVNQQRDKIGVSFGDPKTTPGGNALKFAASIRLQLLSAGAVKEMDPNVKREYDAAIDRWEDDMEAFKKAGGRSAGLAQPSKPKKTDFKGDQLIVGHDIKAFTFKNKVASPKRAAFFRIMFGKGIVEEFAWFEYGQKFGFIIKNGKKFTFQGLKSVADGEIKFSKDGFIDELENVELYEEIRERIQSALIRPVDVIDRTNLKIEAK